MESAEEEARLAALESYQALDRPASDSMQRIVELAAELFRTPIAAISLVDKNRQYFKAQVGLSCNETPREWSFCSVALECEKPVFVVAQPELDPLFSNNPLVIGAPFIRFYAGAPIVDSQGFKLGALCVIDNQGRAYPAGNELRLLADLAKFACRELEIERFQRSLLEKERLLQLAESVSGVGHWRYEIGTGKVTWSDEVYRFFDVKKSDGPLSYQDALARYPARERGEVEEAVAKAIATGEGYSFERKLIQPDGTTQTMRSSAVCELDPSGAVHALFGVFQDVTNHVKATEEAKAAAEAKSEFLANMSHELRTPLTSVIGYGALLREVPGLSGQAQFYVDQVLIASNALMATVNDVLDYSKLESGQLALNVEPVALRTLLAEVVSMFRPQAESKRIAVSMEVDRDVPDALLLDADRSRQIFTNLIGNAVKFTELGSVTACASYHEGNLLVSVKDTGPGIAPEKIPFLFKRFSQVDGSANRAKGGTGLGLAICRGLAHAMNGDVSVKSVLQKGSIFTCVIPATPASSTRGDAQGIGDDLNLSGYRILVIDDCEANRHLVRDVLAGRNAKVSTVSNATLGLELHKRDFFDLILMDIHMPDGYAAAKMFKEDKRRLPIPIIAFTADQEAGLLIARSSSGMGFDDVILKPVAPTSLVHVVRKRLGISHAGVAA